MHSSPPTPYSTPALCTALLLCAAACAAPASTPRPARLRESTAEPAPPPAPRATTRVSADGIEDFGTLSFTFANDLFAQSDNNFTNGAGFLWTSIEARGFADDGFINGFIDFWSFLPHVGDDEHRHYVSFAFGQTMATPSDISDPNPPKDDQPYAGLLSVAAAVHARSETSLHSWYLLTGMVGPSSGAEATQKAIHELTDSDEPQGWDHQIHDEFVLNAYYDWKHRLRRRKLSDSWSTDLITSAGAGAGNAWLGAWGSLVGRVGYHLPDDFGPSVPRTGQSGAPIMLEPRSKPWKFYGFAGLDAQAVGHNIFLDGNTFEDSRSVESEPLVGAAMAGLGLAKGGFALTFAGYKLTDTYDTQKDNNSFGAATLSFKF